MGLPVLGPLYSPVLSTSIPTYLFLLPAKVIWLPWGKWICSELLYTCVSMEGIYINTCFPLNSFIILLFTFLFQDNDHDEIGRLLNQLQILSLATISIPR